MARSFETISVDIGPEKARGIHQCPRIFGINKLYKTWYDFYQTENIDHILGRPYKELPFSTTFTNMNRHTALTTDMQKYMRTLQTKSLMPRNPRYRNKIQMSNYYLLGPLTSYNKISFIKNLFAIKFIHKNFKLKTQWKFTYACQSFQRSISVPRLTFFLSFFFFSQQTACMFPSYYISFSLTHYDSKLHIAVNVIFLCLGIHRFFLNYFQFYLLERPLLLILILFHYYNQFEFFFTNPTITTERR